VEAAGLDQLRGHFQGLAIERIAGSKLLDIGQLVIRPLPDALVVGDPDQHLELALPHVRLGRLGRGQVCIHQLALVLRGHAELFQTQVAIVDDGERDDGADRDGDPFQEIGAIAAALELELPQLQGLALRLVVGCHRNPRRQHYTRAGTRTHGRTKLQLAVR